MSYLARLKQQIPPNAQKGEATKVSKGASVPFVAPKSEPLRDISDQWQEFESLLAIVGPAYRTPEHEYALIRAAARGGLADALTAYRAMAAQIDPNISQHSQIR